MKIRKYISKYISLFLTIALILGTLPTPVLASEEKTEVIHSVITEEGYLATESFKPALNKNRQMMGLFGFRSGGLRSGDLSPYNIQVNLTWDYNNEEITIPSSFTAVVKSNVEGFKGKEVGREIVTPQHSSVTIPLTPAEGDEDEESLDQIVIETNIPAENLDLVLTSTSGTSSFDYVYTLEVVQIPNTKVTSELQLEAENTVNPEAQIKYAVADKSAIQDVPATSGESLIFKKDQPVAGEGIRTDELPRGAAAVSANEPVVTVENLSTDLVYVRTGNHVDGYTTVISDLPKLKTDTNNKYKGAEATDADKAKYNNADPAKKQAFDKAISDAETLINKAKADPTSVTSEQLQDAKDAIKTAEEDLNGSAETSKTPGAALDNSGDTTKVNVTLPEGAAFKPGDKVTVEMPDGSGGTKTVTATVNPEGTGLNTDPEGANVTFSEDKKTITVDTGKTLGDGEQVKVKLKEDKKNDSEEVVLTQAAKTPTPTVKETTTAGGTTKLVVKPASGSSFENGDVIKVDLPDPLEDKTFTIGQEGVTIAEDGTVTVDLGNEIPNGTELKVTAQKQDERESDPATATVRVKKEQLVDAIAKAGDKISPNPADGTPEKAFNDALDKANEVNGKSNATQKEIDEAANALKEATKNLPVQKTPAIADGINKDDQNIKVTNIDPKADQVTIQLEGSTTPLITATKDADGKWTAEGATVTKDTDGNLIIVPSADNKTAMEDKRITATAKNTQATPADGGKTSDPVTYNVKVPEKPTITGPTEYKETPDPIVVPIPEDATEVKLTVDGTELSFTKGDGDTWNAPEGYQVTKEDGKLKITLDDPATIDGARITAKIKDGSNQWSEDSDEITAVTIDPASKVSVTRKPTVDKINNNNKNIVIKAVDKVANKIEIKKGNTTIATLTKDNDGNWSVENGTGGTLSPEGAGENVKLTFTPETPLADEDEIQVTQTNTGDSTQPPVVMTSDEVTADFTDPTAPTGKAVKGDNFILVKKPGDDTSKLTVTVTGWDETAVLTKEGDNWIMNGHVVPVKDENLEIPLPAGKPVSDTTTFTVTAEDPAGNTAEGTITPEARPVSATPEKPTQDGTTVKSKVNPKPDTADYYLVDEAGNKIMDSTKTPLEPIKGIVGEDGTITFTIPEGMKGDMDGKTVFVQVEEPGKDPTKSTEGAALDFAGPTVPTIGEVKDTSETVDVTVADDATELTLTYPDNTTVVVKKVGDEWKVNGDGDPLTVDGNKITVPVDKTKLTKGQDLRASVKDAMGNSSAETTRKIDEGGYDDNKFASMTVTTQPSKLTYAPYETVDLTGLVITLKDENGKTKTVTADQLEANGIRYNKTEALKAADHNMPITFTKSEKTATSDKLTVLTYNATLTPPEKDFGLLTYGYERPAAETFTIKNTGTGPINITGVTSSTPQFEIVGDVTGELAAGATKTFTVQPVEGLALGAYSADIVVANDKGIELKSTVTFKVAGDIVNGDEQQPSDDYVKVTFDAGTNGKFANTTDSKSFWVNKNANPKKIVENLKKPAITPNEGYKFTGWDKEGTTEITAEMTITAQYDQKDNKKYPLSELNPKIKVNNTSALTDAEKNGVKAKVKEQVTGSDVEDNDIVVGNDGSVTVTFKDGSKGTLTGAQTVEQKEASAAPTEVKQEGDKITGKGVPGATVELVDENGTSYAPPVTATVDEEGKFELPLPDSATDGATVKVAQTEEGKTPTNSSDLTLDREKPAAPTVEDLTDGDTSVKVTKPANDATKITVKVGETETVVAEKDSDGVWKVSGISVEGSGADEGKLVIPVTALTQGQQVSVTATDKAGNTSDPTTKTVAANKTATPTVGATNTAADNAAGDNGKTTVTVTPGDSEKPFAEGDVITITYPNPDGGAEPKKVEKTLAEGDIVDGKVAVDLPNDIPKGTTISVTAKQGDLQTSEAGTDTIDPAVGKANAALDNVPDKLKDKTSDSPDYADLSAKEKAVVDAQKELKDVLDKADATQEEIDEATKKLNDALTKLEKKTEAEKNPLTDPEKTKVNDPNNVTSDEQGKIKEAVKKANPNVTDEMIAVDDKGNVTVTYSDSSTNTLGPDQTIEEKKDNEKYPLKPLNPKIVVNDTNNLTDSEKTAIQNQVKDQLTGSGVTDDKIAVGDDGSVTVTYPDNTTNSLTPAQTIIQAGQSPAPDSAEASNASGSTVVTVKPSDNQTFKVGDKVNVTIPGSPAETITKDVTDDMLNDGNIVVNLGKKVEADTPLTITFEEKTTLPGGVVKYNNPSMPITATVPKTDGEKYPLTELNPKVQVADPTNLTDEEKRAVKDAVKDQIPTEANVPDDNIVVDNDGKVTVTYPDGTKNELEGKDTVEKKADQPGVDKDALEKAIDQAKDTKPTDTYKNASPDKKKAFDEALEKANKVNTDPNATQADVDKAKDDLDKAREALDGKPSKPSSGGSSGGSSSSSKPSKDSTAKPDKGELEEKTEDLDDNLDDGTEYTEDSVKRAEDAIREAEKVLADKNATQAEIDRALAKVNHAMRAMRLNVALETIDHYAFMFGYPDDTFRADRTMTRAEVAAMFSRIMLDKPVEGVTYSSDFSDVHEGDWYANVIGYMSGKGLLAGYPDGTFRPNAPITRAEFAAMASRFAKIGNVSGKFFVDIDGHWAENVIEKASAVGWVGGYEGNIFKPNGNITRAEATAIANRMMYRSADRPFVDIHEQDVNQFVDLHDEYWAYNDIMEATNGHDYDFDHDALEENWEALNGKRF